MNLMKIIQNIGPNQKQQSDTLLNFVNQEKQFQQAQKALVKALKQQIIRLQQENENYKRQNKTNLRQLQKTKHQCQSLKQKMHVLKENNQSLLHTLEVFQREFIKRNKLQSRAPLTGNVLSNSNSGPFHLQIVRTVKSTITNIFIKPLKVEEISQFSQLYSYFYQQNSVEEQQVQLFNQLVKQDNKVRTSKIKSLGKKHFFNQRFRHIFWFNAIQNKLKLTQKFYSVILGFLQQNSQNRPPKTSIIDLDIRRMDFKIEDHKAFKLKAQLKKMLELFEIYRPDIGYIQGMSYFAWMFLIRMNPINSFIAFSNIILTDPFVSNLYTFQEDKLKKIVHFFLQCLQDKKPKLYKYSKQLGVDPDLFIIEWAYTFYSRAFSLKIVSKIWDLWFSQGYNVFFKVALAIFQLLESELMQTIESDKYIEILRNNTFKLEQNQFLKVLNKQKLFEQLKLENY